MLFSLSKHLSISYPCLKKIHEAFWSAFSPGNVYLIRPGYLTIYAPPALSPSLWFSLCVSLSLLSPSDPPWWFQCLRFGWLILALDGWQTSSLHSALNVWWITGLLIHTVETVWVKKRERLYVKGISHVKINVVRKDSRAQCKNIEGWREGEAKVQISGWIE